MSDITLLIEIRDLLKSIDEKLERAFMSRIETIEPCAHEKPVAECSVDRNFPCSCRCHQYEY